MNGSAPALHVVEDGGAGVGSRLVEARRRSGQTLEQAAAATRIRRAHLEALERDDPGALPGPVYARGYLRTYAEHLGLDAGALLPALVPAAPPLATPVARALSLRRVAPPQLPARLILTRPALAAVGLVLIVLLFAVYAWREIESARLQVPAAAPSQVPAGAPSQVPAAAPPIASPAPLPSSAPSATPPIPAPRQVRVGVRATEQVWLTATVDGKQAFGGFLAPGQEASFAGQKVKLSSGKGSLLVSVGGGDYQPLGVLSREYSADT